MTKELTDFDYAYGVPEGRRLYACVCRNSTGAPCIGYVAFTRPEATAWNRVPVALARGDTRLLAVEESGALCGALYGAAYHWAVRAFRRAHGGDFELLRRARLRRLAVPPELLLRPGHRAAASGGYRLTGSAHRHPGDLLPLSLFVAPSASESVEALIAAYRDRQAALIEIESRKLL